MTTIRVKFGGGWHNMVITRPRARVENITDHSYAEQSLDDSHPTETGPDRTVMPERTDQLRLSYNGKLSKQHSVNNDQSAYAHKTKEHRTIYNKSHGRRSSGSNDDSTVHDKPGKERHHYHVTFHRKHGHHDKETSLLYLPRMPRVSESTSEMFGISDNRSGANRSDVTEMASGSRYEDHPILRHVQDNVIGHDLIIRTPYGPRRVTYCDYTASGRCLTFIEDFIRQNVMPSYANTHSTTGYNSRQTSQYREEARIIIKECVNACADDVVVFTGSGATAGIHKIAWALKLLDPSVAKETIVFTGPYEHHSNILLWREFGTKVVRIGEESNSGMPDLQQLTEQLKTWKGWYRYLLVCMSAASNVTGIITDVDAVSRIAHQYGAYVIFDYAGGGPYLKIDMNTSKTEYKDAIIVSPHKFIGGPGTPGLVIAKKWLFQNSVPGMVGGGTVAYVTREQHSYTSNIEEREEGGTPAIIESIRAGLVFKLKQEVGTSLIHSRDKFLVRRAFHVWEQNPCIFILGNHSVDKIPIFSFLTIHTETGQLVHHNFISTLLSDLYGIQARGGCACAGPYVQDLMGISESTTSIFTELLDQSEHSQKSEKPRKILEIMKPGFTRINLSYFMDDEMVDFVIQAVDMVTKYGWKLLPLYSFDLKTGSWHNKNFTKTSASELQSLGDALVRGKKHQVHRDASHLYPSYKEMLAIAMELYKEADSSYIRSKLESSSLLLHETLPKDKHPYRWFLTPYQATNILAARNQELERVHRMKYRLPFNLSKPNYLHDQKGQRGYHENDNENVFVYSPKVVRLADDNDSKHGHVSTVKDFPQVDYDSESLEDRDSIKLSDKHLPKLPEDSELPEPHQGEISVQRLDNYRPYKADDNTNRYQDNVQPLRYHTHVRYGYESTHSVHGDRSSYKYVTKLSKISEERPDSTSLHSIVHSQAPSVVSIGSNSIPYSQVLRRGSADSNSIVFPLDPRHGYADSSSIAYPQDPRRGSASTTSLPYPLESRRGSADSNSVPQPQDPRLEFIGPNTFNSQGPEFGTTQVGQTDVIDRFRQDCLIL